MGVLLGSPVPAIGDEPSAFERYRQQMQSEFTDYRTQANREFAAFLEREWAEFEAYKARQLYSEPKFEQMPEARPAEAIPETRIQAERNDAPPLESLGLRRWFDRLVGRSSEPSTLPTPPAPPVTEEEAAPAAGPDEPPAPRAAADLPPVEPAPNESLASVPFLGSPIAIPYVDASAEVRLQGGIDNRSIARFWDRLSRVDSAVTRERLHTVRAAMDLNDWGVALVVQGLAEQVFRDRPMASRLYTWFLLNQMGYRVKVGYSDAAVFLLAPIPESLYGLPYFTLDGRSYYNLTVLQGAASPDSLYIYRGDAPTAEQDLALSLKRPPRLPDATSGRTLRFRYGGQAYAVPMAYDRALKAFYDSYPQIGFDVLFEAPLGERTRSTLVDRLAELVADRDPVEAVNFLLRFVQTAFDYERDVTQFGGERYLFAEQTVAYPASDCEDRVVLFSALVRQLLDLPVVGVQYPNHLAAAVHFPTAVEGDAVHYQGARFVIADPTYRNAFVGEAMPDLVGRETAILPTDAAQALD